jgi:hypothetical protein
MPILFVRITNAEISGALDSSLRQVDVSDRGVRPRLKLHRLRWCRCGSRRSRYVLRASNSNKHRSGGGEQSPNPARQGAFHDSQRFMIRSFKQLVHGS